MRESINVIDVRRNHTNAEAVLAPSAGVVINAGFADNRLTVA
jgi:hypothetical protein